VLGAPLPAVQLSALEGIGKIVYHHLDPMPGKTLPVISAAGKPSIPRQSSMVSAIVIKLPRPSARKPSMSPGTNGGGDEAEPLAIHKGSEIVAV